MADKNKSLLVGLSLPDSLKHNEISGLNEQEGMLKTL